jgi:hypothetical protein
MLGISLGGTDAVSACGLGYAALDAPARRPNALNAVAKGCKHELLVCRDACGPLPVVLRSRSAT